MWEGEIYFHQSSFLIKNGFFSGATPPPPPPPYHFTLLNILELHGVCGGDFMPGKVWYNIFSKFFSLFFLRIVIYSGLQIRPDPLDFLRGFGFIRNSWNRILAQIYYLLIKTSFAEAILTKLVNTIFNICLSSWLELLIFLDPAANPDPKNKSATKLYVQWMHFKNVWVKVKKDLIFKNALRN